MRLHRSKQTLAREAGAIKQSATRSLKSIEAALKRVESSIASELSPAAATEAGFIGDEPAPAQAPALISNQNSSVPLTPVSQVTAVPSSPPLVSPTSTPQPTATPISPPLPPMASLAPPITQVAQVATTAIATQPLRTASATTSRPLVTLSRPTTAQPLSTPLPRPLTTIAVSSPAKNSANLSVGQPPQLNTAVPIPASTTSLSLAAETHPPLTRTNFPLSAKTSAEVSVDESLGGQVPLSAGSLVQPQVKSPSTLGPSASTTATQPISTPSPWATASSPPVFSLQFPASSAQFQSNAQPQPSNIQSLTSAQVSSNNNQSLPSLQSVSSAQPSASRPEPSPSLPPPLPPVTSSNTKIPWRAWFKARPYAVAFSFVLIITLVSGAFGLGKLFRSGPSSSLPPLASQTDQAISTDTAGSILTLNLDTVLASGKKLTLNQLVAGPDSGILGLTGDLQASGSLGASGGSSSLSNNGLVINNKVVCTADGCSLNRIPGPNGLTALPTEVTLLGNVFNGPAQLVQLTGGGLLPVLSGPNLTNLNASNISSGSLNIARLADGSITYAKLNLSGSLLNSDIAANAAIADTKLATITTAGKVADSALSANVALLAGSGPQTFTGNNRFQSSTNSTAAFAIQNAAGTSNLLIANTTSTRIAIAQATAAYTLDVAGDINSTTGVRVGGALLCQAGGCVAAGGSASYLQNGTALQTSANFNLQSAATTSVTGVIRALTGQSADLFQLKDQAAVNVLTVGPTGNVLVQPSTNSTAGFSVQNALGTSLLISGDTLNSRVGIARAVPPVYTLDVGGDINSSTRVLINGVQICTVDGCATGSPGNFVQNGTTLQTANFNIQSAAVGSVVASMQGASGQTGDILDVIGKGVGDVNLPIATFGASGRILFQNAIDSTTAFRLQNLAGNNYILLNTSGAALSLGDAGIASTIQIGNTTGAVAQTINIGNNATAASTSTVVLGSTIGTSATTIETGSGTLAIGNGATAHTIAIGSGAAVQAVTIGSTNSTSALTLQAGTGNLNIGNDGVAKTTTINIGTEATGADLVSLGSANVSSILTLESGTAAAAIQIGNGATAHGIQIGTGGAVQTIVLGSTNTTSATTIQGGTGANAIALTQGSGGTITIGGTAGAAAVSIQCGTSTCGLGNNATDHSTTIGSTTGVSLTTLQGGTGGINIGIANVAQTIQIGNTANAVAQTINIGNNTTAASTSTVVLGSTIGTSPLTIQAGTSGILVKPADSTTAFQIQNSSGASLFTADTTNSIINVTNSNLRVGKQTDSAGAWAKISNATAGTIASGGTSAIDGAYSQAVYNGSLYVGTSKANAAEVYRYDGGTTWTKVSQATAGTIASGGTASIDRSESMAVFNGNLYIGTNETDAAEVYRYDGDTTWTKVSQATAGTIASGGTANIDEVHGLTSYSGALYATTGGVGGTNAAEVYRYDGGTTWTKVSQATAGTIASGGTANIDRLDGVAVYNGKLYIGTNEPDVAEVYRYDGGTSWTRVSQATAGTIASGGTANIIRAASLAVYNGSLYVGTRKDNAAELYRYDGGTTWTRVSQATAGTLAPSGTANIDYVFSMAVSNGALYLGTFESSSAEIYSYTQVEGQSYALQFNASSDEAGSTEQASYPNLGNISFLAEQQANNPQSVPSTGIFLFSHGITTTTGAYDVAEDYPTRDDTLEAGDVVAIDPSETGFVRKSSVQYDRTTVGIYSSKPALRLGQRETAINGGTAVPIALAGRVQVKVSNENGPIEPGDYLTSSSIPGYAMRATSAGLVIGKALASFNGTSGKVLMFIGVQYYSPAMDLQGSLVNINNLTVATLTVNGDAQFKGNLTLAGHIIGNSDTSGVINMPAGSSSANHSFTRAYGSIPNIVVTPESDPGSLRYWVTKTTTQFTIHLSNNAPSDIKFDYFVQQ